MVIGVYRCSPLTASVSKLRRKQGNQKSTQLMKKMLTYKNTGEGVK